MRYLIWLALSCAASITYSEAPSPEVWWASASRPWSGHVKVTVVEAAGMVDDFLQTGAAWEYTFDDSLNSCKWSYVCSDGRHLVASRTPECFYADVLGGGAIDTWPLDQKGVYSRWLNMDPRQAGLCSSHEWGDSSFSETKKSILDRLSLRTVEGQGILGEIVSESTFAYPAGSGQDGQTFSYSHRRSLDIDPVSMLVTSMADSFRYNGEPSSDTTITASVQYDENEGGVHVPGSWKAYSSVQGGAVVKSFKLTFAWSEVNHEFDQSRFTPTGMGLRGGTMVVERRLGDPVITEILPRNGTDDLPGVTTIVPPIAKVSKSPSSKVFLIGNLVILVAVILWLCVRRYQRP